MEHFDYTTEFAVGVPSFPAERVNQPGHGSNAVLAAAEKPGLIPGFFTGYPNPGAIQRKRTRPRLCSTNDHGTLSCRGSREYGPSGRAQGRISPTRWAL